jgi:nicotinate phosphoribosyltransferase
MIINSILDTDLYKLTMQQAIMQKFPYAGARFKFINRGAKKFSASIAKMLQEEIKHMSSLALTSSEKDFLKKTCPFLTPVYLDLLSSFRYDPSEVFVGYNNGTKDLEVSISGPWYRSVLWEVPLMAIISELYNRENHPHYGYDSKHDANKFRKLKEEDVVFADFGTRRRLNYSNQNRILDVAIGTGSIMGTSNVHFAHQKNLKPIGTHAHEWFMYHGAIYGYTQANHSALQNWADVFHGNLGIALSDTYTSDLFFHVFDAASSRLFDGVRHDSGCPYDFGAKAIAHYRKHNIDPMTKTIVFSDGLDIDKAINIKNAFYDKINCSFGIGTNLTNDIEGISPLNIVIKMTECTDYPGNKWTQTVKLSDDKGKNTGFPEDVDFCKTSLGIKPLDIKVKR